MLNQRLEVNALRRDVRINNMVRPDQISNLKYEVLRENPTPRATIRHRAILTLGVAL